MGSLTFSFQLVAGAIATLVVVNIVFLIKIKLLKKKNFLNALKIIKIEDELTKTKEESANIQKQIGDLKGADERVNTELPQLQSALKEAIQERERLNKENEDHKTAASRRQNELHEALVLYAELQDKLTENKHHTQKLEDINQTLTIKIQELDQNIASLLREKETNAEIINNLKRELGQAQAQHLESKDMLRELQDTEQNILMKKDELEAYLKELKEENEKRREIISQQRKELESVLTQLTDLQDTLKIKEQHIQEANDANRLMSTKIQELEASIAELSREKEANATIIARQQQEIEETVNQRSEFRDKFKGKEQDIHKLQNTNQGMAARIQELESNNAELSREKKSYEKITARQQQELEQAVAQRLELKKTLQDKEQLIQKLENINQNMPIKIQELEAGIAELNREKEINATIITRQQQELEETKRNLLGLQDALKEKEGHIQKLKEVNQAMSTKFTETQSLIQGLEKEMQSKSAIFQEIKKEAENKKIREAIPEPVSVEKSESEAARENKEKRLKDLLTKNKLISEAALEKALELQKKHGGNLLRFLFVNTDINEKELVEQISTEFKVPYLPVRLYEIPDDIIKAFPSALAEEYWVLPVDKIENNLMLVMVDPFDNVAIRDIEKVTGCQVKVYIGLFSEIAEKIQRLYKVNIRGLDTEGNSVCPLFVKTETYKGRERRKAVRFKSRLPVRIADDNQVALSTTEDISWDGLSFKLNRELPISSMITIQLSLPEPTSKQENRFLVPALAQVRRATPLEDKKFMIGVQLVKVPKDDFSVIIQYISENQNKTVSLDSDKSSMYLEMLNRLQNNHISTLQ